MVDTLRRIRATAQQKNGGNAMAGLKRRHLLQGSAGGVLAATTRTAWAQSKPEKLVLVGENQRAWKRTLIEEVAPAFEKETGIKIEFTLLPVDAWRARLKAELSAESTGIDLALLSVQMAGWMSPHLLDHNEVRSEEHTSELQSRSDLVCRLLLEKKKQH